MTPLDSLVPPFLLRLKVEEAILRTAHVLLADAHAALRRGDLAAVAAAGPAQEEAAVALRNAEANRVESSAELARAVDLPPDGLTLAALAARLPEPWAADVRAARAGLASAAGQLADLRTRNANLLRQLRSYFRGVLSSLAADAPARYGPSGAPLGPAGGGAVTARG